MMLAEQNTDVEFMVKQMTDNKIPLTNCNTWIRLAYMVLFTAAVDGARLVIAL